MRGPRRATTATAARVQGVGLQPGCCAPECFHVRSSPSLDFFFKSEGVLAAPASGGAKISRTRKKGHCPGLFWP